MCFLKNIASIDKLPTRYQGVVSPQKDDSDTDPFHEEEILMSNKTQLFPLFTKPIVDQKEMMFNCLQVLSFSSQVISHLDQKISQSCTAMDQSFQWLEQNTPPEHNDLAQDPPVAEKPPGVKTQNSVQNVQPSSMQANLFGVRDYLYRLQLDGEFPETLYKDRNFGLRVRLIDKEDGKESRNSNMINLCLGVATESGEWVTTTRDGSSFMKGRLEAELYHGEAGFVKLAPRDVSRSLPGKVINLVVYAKPSILKYAGQSALEESVDPEMIEPLIIKAVPVMAKRRD